MCMLVMLNVLPLAAQHVDLRGQVSAWLLKRQTPKSTSTLGFRYLPSLSFHEPLNKKYRFRFETSLNIYPSGQFGREYRRSTEESPLTIKPYRLWIRLATDQFEARLGLQKINFGSAVLLRPLMWFDRIDPRDPLQITDGVYALLFRYFFLNNANIWFWALYGSDSTKGWEVFPTSRKGAEFGGRLQYPLWAGEIGFAFHHRQTDFSSVMESRGKYEQIPEARFALDGKWDVGVGLWFEASLVHKSTDLFYAYQKMATLGCDYTFGLGNGLHLLLEQFFLNMSGRAGEFSDTKKFSAISADYPLGLLDKATSIVYYDWSNRETYKFVDLQRLYDRWSYHLILFWNPRQYSLYRNSDADFLLGGKGWQFMIVFNY